MKKTLSIADAWRFRSTERKLFFACFCTIALGYLGLSLNDMADQEGWSRKDFLPLMVFGLSLCLIHLWFVCFRFQGDTKLLGAVVLLGGFGILAQHRMGLFDLDHPWKLSHLAYPIGITLMLITSSLFKGSRIVILQRLGWLSALLSLGLMVALLLTGTRYRGATYAAGQLTPTEIIKLLMVLFLASALASREKAIRKSLESKGGLHHPHDPSHLPSLCLPGRAADPSTRSGHGHDTGHDAVSGSFLPHRPVALRDTFFRWHGVGRVDRTIMALACQGPHSNLAGSLH